MTGLTGRPSFTRKTGPSDKTFGRQTDIAWLPDGTFFVSDGYEETRVVKFDKNGKFLMAWGEMGDCNGKEKRPGYFNTVHGIVIDNQRRIYVDDRANRRVQIFDENGKFLNQWYLGDGPTAIYHIVHDRRPAPLDVGRPWELQVLQIRPEREAAVLVGHDVHRSRAGCGECTSSAWTRTATCTRPKCGAAARRSSSRGRAPTRPC